MPIELISKSLLAKNPPKASFKEGFDIKTKVRVVEGSGQIAEFISSDNFASQFYERQRYEVESGRDMEPILYTPLYDITTDPTVPRNVTIYTLGPAGVVFEEVLEGGEVKFASVGQGTKVLNIKHYASGIQYTKDIFKFNELFRLANFERQFGIAFNALMNHIHFTPILSHTYATANKTDGTTLTSFKATASMAEKYLRTLEAAMTAGVNDTTNPRRGPYVLLCNTGDVFTFERALGRVPQQGFDMQSSALSRIQTVIEYNGWTGTRGLKTTAYAGVPSGKAYLVDVGNRVFDFQSIISQPLQMTMGNPDVSRFIMEQNVWDTYFGVFADPARAVQEITLPVAASGAA
ncbi:MAG TPA: hypothetical protein PLZ51_17425 [Aggregatilineales bacterium]|nr:hypothetical protein [Aggregatilineales bacterium]